MNSKKICFAFSQILLIMQNISDGYVISTSNQNYYNVDSFTSSKNKSVLQKKKKEWTHRSMEYYFKLMRDYPSQVHCNEEENNDEAILQRQVDEQIAKRLYFARRKIKSGVLHHAERIYRKLIDDIMFDPELKERCDHSTLAVSTLLLALLLQRMGDIKGTRSTFLNFFRTVEADGEKYLDCCCSAKVLQAFALFEMKQGHQKKSLELITKAVKIDNSLASILKWKQFRDAYSAHSSSVRFSHIRNQLGNIAFSP